MAGFNVVDTTGFDNAIIAFETAKQCYDNARTTLGGNASFLKSAWTGKGGDKYESVSRSILQLLEDDGESLQYIIANLKEIRRLYGEADTTIAKDIDQADIQ